MKVFLLGRDGVGWSIDRDREYTGRALVSCGHRLTRNPVLADVVYCVWWNVLGQRRWRVLRHKPTVAVVTNDLAHQEDEFARVNAAVDIWVAANVRQKDFLHSRGIPPAAVVWSPFYVEEDVFRESARPRAELAVAAGVDPAAIEGRFLVGSFQRDSLGADLSQPKWQKDPGMLVEILDRVRDPRLLLVLAGPRRHWLLEECRRRALPYLFVGREPAAGAIIDDLADNTLPGNRIAVLWNLLDLYVVTSRSEGGPKAVFEAALTGTPIMSTPVGMAEDLLPKSMVFRGAAEGAALLRQHLTHGPPEEFGAFVGQARDLNRFEAFAARVDSALRAAAERTSVR